MRKKSTKPDTPAKRKQASTTVPGTYLGFSLQATRFLVHLLKAKAGDTVCLELFEDVGVEKADGSRIAEQDKSNLATNPLSNRSPQFWKTFRNWVEALRSKLFDPEKTSFVIYASRAVTGRIAESFHKAITIPDAIAAIAEADSLLGLASPDAPPSDSDDPFASCLRTLLQSDKGLLAKVIVNFTIDSANGSPHDEIRPLLLDKFVSEDAYEDVVRWAHGWVKTRVDRLLELQQPARVTQSEFHKAILSYVRSHDRVDILRSMAAKPSDENITAEMAFRDYVRQLRLIDLDDLDILEAVNDYIRAATDRTIWSEQGLIDESSLDKLAEELASAWRNKKRRVSIGYADKPENMQGQVLYSDCMDQQTQLDNLATPTHFIRGSWHALADDRTIGWHPRYGTQLDSVVLSAESSTAGKP